MLDAGWVLEPHAEVMRRMARVGVGRMERNGCD
jgi:hypothetical protein